MASIRTFKCSNCALVFTSSGPHVFYRDDQGKILYLHYPWTGPQSRRIEGTVYEEYCLHCQAQRRYIFENGLRKDGTGPDRFTKRAPKSLPHCEICGGHQYYKPSIPVHLSSQEKQDLVFECPRCKVHALKFLNGSAS